MAFELPALPNFQTNIPQADTVGELARVASLRNMLSEAALRQALAPGQIQMQQQQVQQQQIATKLQQIQLQDSQVMSDWLKNGDATAGPSDFSMRDKIATFTGIDKNDPMMGVLAGLAKGSGSAKGGMSGPGLLAQAQAMLQRRTEYNKGTEEEQTIRKNDHVFWQETLAELHNAPEDQRSPLLAAKLPLLMENSKSDPFLQAAAKGLAGHPELIDQVFNAVNGEIAALGLRQKKAEATEAEQKVIPPGAATSPFMQAEVARSGAEAQAKLNVESSPQALELAKKKAQLEAQARQQAAQGDPNVAGEMLAKGDLTLTDLKSRGTTPQYITKAIAAAQKIQPNYNPADEVIAESVAKSPTANQFFGSANSLIGKGGTLDQLEKLGKNIPQHDFPVLNTVDDWQKVARGKGPLAGYAATALGVADDYGKVMGGGNASDHARDAALALFSKAASPEQRTDAIQSTRDAVQSQRDSRIGNNQFLKRQYGTEVSKGGAAGHSFTFNGQKYENVPEELYKKYKGQKGFSE